MIDEHRLTRALGRSLIGLVALAALVAPALASATVLAGAADDPRGDSVAEMWSIPDQAYVPLTPDSGNRAMDLTRAEVYYDSDAGNLQVTYIGKLSVGTHQGTFLEGRIAGCGSSVSEIAFEGHIAATEPSEPRRGTARLEGPSLPDGALDGFVYWGAEGVTLGFTDSALLRRDYRCALDLRATWAESGNTRNRDGIAPFCLVAGCLDPPAPPGSSQVVGSPSVVVTAQGASIDARCSILPGKINTATARMKLMQRASHKGSRGHRRAVTRQARVLASHRTSLRATYRALCT